MAAFKTVFNHNVPTIVRAQLIAPTVLLVSSMLWGLSWLPLRALAAAGINSLQIISFAYFFLFLITLPFVWRRCEFFLTNRKAMLGIFFAGGLANACFNYALIHGEVLRVMVLFYLLPVWGVLGGKFILKERTSVWRWLGVVLAVCGALILLDVKNILNQPPRWIDLIALLSGFFLAATILLFRGVENAPLLNKLSTLFLGSAVIAGLAMFFAANAHYAFPSITQIFWLMAFAFGWLLWANLGSQWAVTQLPAGRSAIIMVMELVAAAVSAVFVGGEVFSVTLLIGGGLILCATAIEVVQAFGEPSTLPEVKASAI